MKRERLCLSGRLGTREARTGHHSKDSFAKSKGYAVLMQEYESMGVWDLGIPPTHILIFP
jgi:hypothetical protein